MTDDAAFSSDLPNDAVLDQTLNDMEQAMMRFERLLLRHRGSLSKLVQKKTGNTFIAKGLSVFLGALPQLRGGSEGNSQQNNRFPASGGQFLADLAASIRSSGGRNL